MAISINDFQRISNGTFNAGDITLTSSGKLDKVNYRIAASQSNPRIFSLNSESDGTAFGSVYCECTFTVTGIGSGNPQISATQISQTFNMD